MHTMGLHVGTIVRGADHVTYVVHVMGPVESDPGPKPEDCSFGSFVKIVPHDGGSMNFVGLIVDSALMDRDALRAGPRLAPDLRSMTVLFPDFIDERVKLVYVMIIGFTTDGDARHDFPDITPSLGDPVIKMADDEVKAFHMVGGAFKVGYYSQAIGYKSALTLPLMIRVLGHLARLFPARVDMLRLLRNALEYRWRVEGGFSS